MPSTAGLEAFDALAEEEPGTFYLTDYLVRHFDRLVIEGLGLDRHPELRDDYFGNYTAVLYLAQTEDPALEAEARAAAERLGLAYRYRFTGMGGLERVHEPRTAAPHLEQNAMAQLTIVYWRDIPAQVIAKAGRQTARRQLSERFEKAIDRAAMRAKLRDDDSYLAEWRRAEPLCPAATTWRPRRPRRRNGWRPNSTTTACQPWSRPAGLDKVGEA